MSTSSHSSIAKLQTEIRGLLPRLSSAQANVLGEMVYAMLMVDGCGMTRMCSFLSELLGKPMNTLRQKYREMYYEKCAKAGVKRRGDKRREIVVEDHFADLLRGVLKQWQGPKTLVLALDGSTLTDRFDVLSISVVTRGCGIRVAWTMLQGHTPGEWRPHWERMLAQLRDVVPAEWTVLVMADRGLYAPWLFEAIRANGWHPLLRVKKNVTFRAEGEECFGSMGQRVKKPGGRWKGQGEWSETGGRMSGTLVARWEAGYDEPIFAVTDLPPRQAQAAWYQMRFWIEDDYKDGKRGWFHWEQTKMTDPGRASRLWLVLALALQHAIVLGSELEAREQAREANRHRKGSSGGAARRRGRPAIPEKRPRGREQSVLMRGVMAIRAAESGGQNVLPKGAVRAEALPKQLYPVSRVPKSYQLKKQRRAEKKRNRQRGKTKAQREQRAQAKAAEQAAKEVRRQVRQERRAAKEAAQLAARQEKQARRQGKQENSCVSLPLNSPSARRLRASDCQRRVSSKPELPEPRSPEGALNDESPRREPLLRLSRGRLQPPHRPVRTKIRTTGEHGPAC